MDQLYTEHARRVAKRWLPTVDENTEVGAKDISNDSDDIEPLIRDATEPADSLWQREAQADCKHTDQWKKAASHEDSVPSVTISKSSKREGNESKTKRQPAEAKTNLSSINQVVDTVYPFGSLLMRTINSNLCKQM